MRATMMVGTSHTSAARRAAVSFWTNSLVGTSTCARGRRSKQAAARQHTVGWVGWGVQASTPNRARMPSDRHAGGEGSFRSAAARRVRCACTQARCQAPNAWHACSPHGQHPATTLVRACAHGRTHLAAHVSALLRRRELILEVHRSRSGLDHCLHQLKGVEVAAEAGLGVGDNGRKPVGVVPALGVLYLVHALRGRKAKGSREGAGDGGGGHCMVQVRHTY